jgi:hypothetical protein
MSDEKRQHGGNGNGGFEHEDLGAKAVFAFLLGLVLTGFLVYFVVTGMYDYLDHYERAHQPAVSPLKQNVEVDTRDTNRARVSERIERTFPEPRLETNERTELAPVRLKEEEELNSYGWVNQQAGTVHIPIERAMQLIAQRGLPVRPEGAENTAASNGKAVAAKTRSMKP